MPTFSPPYTVDSFKRFHHNDSSVAKAVLRYYRGPAEGITVYVLSTGAVTTVRPIDESLIAREYRGGYIHEITTEEAAVLTGAGYEVTE